MFELFVLLLMLQPDLNTSVDAFVDSYSWNSDRNKNDISDISIITISGIYRLVIIAFDNDEDGLIDAGFVDFDNDRQLDKLWIDANGDGKPTKDELEDLRMAIPFGSKPTSMKIFKEEFYHITIWSVIYYDSGNSIGFIERFVDSNQDGKADVYKLISGQDNLRLITFIDLDYDDNYDMICHKHECSIKDDIVSIPKEKQTEFPVLSFKKSMNK